MNGNYSKLAALVFSVFIAQVSFGASRGHQIDFRDSAGKYVLEYRHLKTRTVKTQPITMALSYDEAGNQVLSYKWKLHHRRAPS